jgi:hypothetical protein
MDVHNVVQHWLYICLVLQLEACPGPGLSLHSTCRIQSKQICVGLVLLLLHFVFLHGVGLIFQLLYLHVKAHSFRSRVVPGDEFRYGEEHCRPSNHTCLDECVYRSHGVFRSCVQEVDIRLLNSHLAKCRSFSSGLRFRVSSFALAIRMESND